MKSSYQWHIFRYPAYTFLKKVVPIIYEKLFHELQVLNVKLASVEASLEKLPAEQLAMKKYLTFLRDDLLNEK